jgi:hypothetical protein
MKKPTCRGVVLGVVLLWVATNTLWALPAHAQVHGVTLQNCHVILRESGKVMSSFWPGLTYNPCTAAVQQWLNEIYLLRIAHGQEVTGWTFLVVDGLYGTKTTLAVFEYRKRYNVVPVAGSIDAGAMGYMALHCVSKPWGHQSPACF